MKKYLQNNRKPHTIRLQRAIVMVNRNTIPSCSVTWYRKLLRNFKHLINYHHNAIQYNIHNMERKKHPPREWIQKVRRVVRFQIWFFWRKKLEKKRKFVSPGIVFSKNTFLNICGFPKIWNRTFQELSLPRTFLAFTEKCDKIRVFQCFSVFLCFIVLILRQFR